LYTSPCIQRSIIFDSSAPESNNSKKARWVGGHPARFHRLLTPRGRDLLPALTALADWGAVDLAGPRPTDALRAHWFALPLMARLAEVAAPVEGTVNIVLDEGAFHIQIGAAEPAYGHGLAEHPYAELTFDAVACAAVARGEATLPELIKTSQTRVDGDGPLARALRRQ
jgi:hypothetical protein